jgi:hypothetical protein
LAGTDARINIRRNSWEEEEKNDVCNLASLIIVTAQLPHEVYPSDVSIIKSTLSPLHGTSLLRLKNDPDPDTSFAHSRKVMYKLSSSSRHFSIEERS